jgi:hypothetical protein
MGLGMPGEGRKKWNIAKEINRCYSDMDIEER